MLRFAMNFDHVTTRNVQETWIGTCGYDIFRKFAVANKGLIVNDEGFLSCAAGRSSNNNTQPYINISPWLAKSGFTKLWLGCLIKVYEIGNTGVLMYLTSDAGGVSFQSILNYSEITQIAGNEIYIELEIDIENSTVGVWFDDVLLKSVSLSGPSKTNLLAGNFWVALNLTTTNTSGLIGVKQVIAGDNIDGGDKMMGRPGRRNLYPIEVDVVTGSNWRSTTGGTLLNVMTTDLDEPNPPLAENVGFTGNLECSLKAPTIPTTGVGISSVLLMAALKGSASTVKSALSIRQNGVKTPDELTSLNTTLTYGQKVGVFGKAPDGSAWTPSKIDGTVVIVTPDT